MPSAAPRPPRWENGRPNCTITLDRVDEEHLGAFLQMMEFQTAFMGELLDINAFDQEGVNWQAVYLTADGPRGFEKYRRQLRRTRRSARAVGRQEWRGLTDESVCPPQLKNATSGCTRSWHHRHVWLTFVIRNSVVHQFWDHRIVAFDVIDAERHPGTELAMCSWRQRSPSVRRLRCPS